MENTPNNRSDVVRKSTEDCAICLDKIQEKKVLKCLHSFCSACIDSVFKFKPACPICNTYHGVYTGNQPNGTMTVMRGWQRLPGFENCGSIVIQYSFPAGIQGVRLTLLAEVIQATLTYSQSLCRCTVTTSFRRLISHFPTGERCLFLITILRLCLDSAWTSLKHHPF